MTLHVTVDDVLCSGYGNCVLAGPEVFDLDDDSGLAVVHGGRPLETDGSAVREAEADCPARAIIVADA